MNQFEDLQHMMVLQAFCSVKSLFVVNIFGTFPAIYLIHDLDEKLHIQNYISWFAGFIMKPRVGKQYNSAI